MERMKCCLMLFCVFLGCFSAIGEVLYTVKTDDQKPLQKRLTFTEGQDATPGDVLSTL